MRLICPATSVIMKPPPKTIDGGIVVYYSPVDHRHQPTGACRQIVGGELQGTAAGLFICQLDDDSGFYLLRCDADWSVVTDTYHSSLGEAKQQAEFEYTGVSATWGDA